MNLFIDTANWNLVLILEKAEQIIDQVTILKTKKVSDLLVENIQTLLEKHQLTIHDCQNLYVTTGPGSYTGERVGLTMIKTLKILNPQFNIYTINSLAYQAGLGQKVSVLDARGGKVYLGVYNDQQPKIPEQVVNQAELKTFLIEHDYQTYQVVQDYENCDFGQNYLVLKPYFTLVENPELLVPFYLKNFL